MPDIFELKMRFCVEVKLDLEIKGPAWTRIAEFVHRYDAENFKDMVCKEFDIKDVLRVTTLNPSQETNNGSTSHKSQS